MNMNNKAPVTAVMVGAGFRGREVYAKYAEKHPERLQFTAVAEPDATRRELFKRTHKISEEGSFKEWTDLLNKSKGKMADTAFICTQDNMHYQPAIHALNLGYDLVLEKPISPSLDECHDIVETSQKSGRLVQVCHVLRYTPFWKKVKQIVASGEIGDIIHYDHSENVSYWHFGHSYVRGHYKNEANSSPLILAKSCHDLDLMYWIIGRKPVTVQSKGELTFYKPENAPQGAPDRCTDGCPVSETCPWYAPRLYVTAEPLLSIGLHAPSGLTRLAAHMALNHRKLMSFAGLFSKSLRGILNWNQFPATVITNDLSIEGKMKALREGPYGKCIFKSGNDVVDHQVSTFTFPGGITGTLTVHGVSDLEGREIRIFGTKGTLRGYFRYNGEQITVTDFRNSKSKTVYKAGLSLGGHGGGDFGLMDSFVQVMSRSASPEKVGTTDVAGAMESHYMAFAAEEARLNSKTVELHQYRH